MTRLTDPCVDILKPEHTQFLKFAQSLVYLPKEEMLAAIKEQFDLVEYTRPQLREGDIVLWNVGDRTLHISKYSNGFFHTNWRGRFKKLALRVFYVGVGPVWIVRNKCQ